MLGAEQVCGPPLPFVRAPSGSCKSRCAVEARVQSAGFDCVESRAEVHEKLPGVAPRDSTATSFLLADHVL